jgi:hypothetical protein
MVQVGQHVGAARGIPVYADCARLFVNPAADIQNPHPS